MIRKRSLLLISLLLLSCGSQPACLKQSNNFTSNSNTTVGELKQATLFADDDERIVSNFNRALNELEAITAFCADEDWVVAAQRYENFQQATRVRPQPKLSQPDISLALLDAFDLYNVKLQEAINAEVSSDAIFATNQLSNILNDLIIQMEGNSGAEARREVRRMFFLRREMEWWANQGNETMLKVRAARLRKAWSDLRPVVFDHKGAEVAEQFDEIAQRLDRLDSIAAYEELSVDLTHAVNGVSDLFTEQR